MKTKTVLVLIGLVATAGCAARSAPARATQSSSERVRALRRQLAGHLERAEGCFTEAQLRDPNASGLVRFGFTIEPDGRVDAVDVDAWSEDDRMLAACVRSRLVSLFFAPAPPRAVRIDRTFYSCPDARGGVCRLGAARPLEAEPSRDLIDRVNAGLAERDDELETCAREVGGAPAVLDVRLELGADGRIMAGQLMDSFPAQTDLSRCAVGPLLGARVEGEAPGDRVQLRYVYRLGASGDGRRAELR